MKKLLLLLLLVGCVPKSIPIIIMDDVLVYPDLYMNEKVELNAWFFDSYAKDYYQFADSGNYIFVKYSGNQSFIYQRWYKIQGEIQMCQISDSKERLCLVATEIS